MFWFFLLTKILMNWCLQLIWEGLGLGGGAAVGNWSGYGDKCSSCHYTIS